MSSGNGYEKVKAELEQARTKRWFSRAKAQQDDSFGTLPKPEELGKPVGRNLLWFTQEMNYDPVAALRALRVPALFLFGNRDQLIPVQESVRVLQRVLGEDAHHDFTIREFTNDDHEMRVGVGETRGEIDPDYLSTMREWLATHVLKRGDDSSRERPDFQQTKVVPKQTCGKLCKGSRNPSPNRIPTQSWRSISMRALELELKR
jgi:hypothetical protein